MVKDTQNPYIAEYQRLLKEYEANPNDELKKQLEEVEAKSREFLQEALNSISDQRQVIADKAQETHENTPKYKITRQYKEMCDIYKEADRLIKTIRTYKKDIREEMAQKREKIRGKNERTQM